MSHANLPPLASRFVDVGSMPWEKTRYPGVEQKTLFLEKETGLLTALMRMAPGAALPDHEHVKIEQTYVLEGSLVCGEGECRAEQVLPARRARNRFPRQRLGKDLGRGAQALG
jgi:anti-sigma factor ChrR (cupin superfamily)